MTNLIKTTAVLLCLATPGLAATVDMATTATGKTDNTMNVLGEGHMIVATTSTYDPFDMGDHPFSGMTGGCHGSFEIQVPAARGGGHCVFTDGDGNMSINRWEVTGLSAEGATLGTWTVIGGTGKFAGSAGGGSFSNASDREAGTFANTITGAMTLK